MPYWNKIYITQAWKCIFKYLEQSQKISQNRLSGRQTVPTWIPLKISGGRPLSTWIPLKILGWQKIPYWNKIHITYTWKCIFKYLEQSQKPFQSLQKASVFHSLDSSLQWLFSCNFCFFTNLNYIYLKIFQAIYNEIQGVCH